MEDYMDALYRLQEFCREVGCAFAADEPMRLHTSFKIGGCADLFIQPESSESAALVIKKAKALSVPLLYIGKGSDLLVSDSGIRGAVLALDEQSSRPQVRDGEDGTIVCPAGASLSRLCAFAREHALTGLEFAWGIPGSVGGAVYMNAGAYGGETAQVLTGVWYLDADGEKHYKSVGELDMGYRHSWFADHPECLITDAEFRLEKGNTDAIRAKMDDLMERRKTKQPLEYPSAGSTFKRPDGAYASELIDRCGLKGHGVGGARVSEKHAGFVINYDNATCADVLTLIEDVKREVYEKTGFQLECEVRLLI